MRYAALALALMAAPAFASAELSGTYTLIGLADAGGELRLNADGTYRWSISTATVNRSSTGRWTRTGSEVVLTSDDPENPSGIARKPAVERWNDTAERQYLRIRFETEWGQVLDRCPLLRVRIPAFVPPPADPAKDWHSEARNALHRAAAARSAALESIGEWDKAREGSPEQAARLKAAGDAMIAYEAAFSAAQDAHERAKLPAPAENLIELPARCQVPRSLPSFAPLPPERHPQIAIVIGDPEGGSAYVGVKLAVRFSDGSEIATESGPGGWAMLPVQPGKSVSAIGVAIDIEQPARFTIPASLDGAGILVVDINAEALAVRDLEPKALTLAKDGSLKSATGGSYARMQDSARLGS